jgi:hypothetical protein
MSNYYKFYDTLRMIPPIRIKESWLVSTFEESKELLKLDQVYSVERVGIMFSEELLNNNTKVSFAKEILEQWVVHKDQGNKEIKQVQMQQMNNFVKQKLMIVVEERLELCLKEINFNSFDFKYDIALPIMSAIAMELYQVPKTDNTKIQEELIFKHTEIVSILLEDISMGIEKGEQFANSLLYLIKLGENFDGLSEEFSISEYDSSKYTIDQIQQTLILGTLVYNTVNLIANAMYVLYSNKTKFNSANIKEAIVEAVRLEAPVQAVLRISNEDVLVKGQKISKGDSITIVIGSANRDDTWKAYENPNEFIIGRDKTPLLTFGYGVHACIGQHLSFNVAQYIIQKFLFNENFCIENVEWNDTIRGYRSLISINAAIKN